MPTDGLYQLLSYNVHGSGWINVCVFVIPSACFQLFGNGAANGKMLMTLIPSDNMYITWTCSMKKESRNDKISLQPTQTTSNGELLSIGDIRGLMDLANDDALVQFLSTFYIVLTILNWWKMEVCLPVNTVYSSTLSFFLLNVYLFPSLYIYSRGYCKFYIYICKC